MTGETTHTITIGDASRLATIRDGSIDLIVTSPPYPMIAMWDEAFCSLAPAVAEALSREQGDAAFEAMHGVLDAAWSEAERVLRPGGFCCINIGDAVRTVGGRFALYTNHARIIATLRRLGLTLLPMVIWRKTTNAPNKFMGSGMLPGGAYVTLEHEFILIARKPGGERRPDEQERMRRRESAIFWEERNEWFSDVWRFTGTRQHLSDRSRKRSGAFPFELPYRLIAMYSRHGDVVLDPFVGTGTTCVAAAALARSSIGVDIDASLVEEAAHRFRDPGLPDRLAAVSDARLTAHRRFIEERTRPANHRNARYAVAVVTGQETDLQLPRVLEIHPESAERFMASYW